MANVEISKTKKKLSKLLASNNVKFKNIVTTE